MTAANAPPRGEWSLFFAWTSATVVALGAVLAMTGLALTRTRDVIPWLYVRLVADLPYVFLHATVAGGAVGILVGAAQAPVLWWYLGSRRIALAWFAFTAIGYSLGFAISRVVYAAAGLDPAWAWTVVRDPGPLVALISAGVDGGVRGALQLLALHRAAPSKSRYWPAATTGITMLWWLISWYFGPSAVSPTTATDGGPDFYLGPYVRHFLFALGEGTTLAGFLVLLIRSDRALRPAPRSMRAQATRTGM